MSEAADAGAAGTTQSSGRGDHEQSTAAPAASRDGPAPAVLDVSEDTLQHIGSFFEVLAETEKAEGTLQPGSIVAKHRYQYDGTYSPEDQEVLNWFLNCMDAQNVPQEEVTRVLARYHELVPHRVAQNVAAYREAERMDLADRSKAEAAMRLEWGPEYDVNVRLVNRYLDGLPKAQREAIEFEVLPDGRRALNDPATLKRLAMAARNPGGKMSSEKIDAEIAGIEKLMRENRSAYNRDEAKQARLRDLYRMKNGAQ